MVKYVMQSKRVAASFRHGAAKMARQKFTVEFDFVPTMAHGPLQHRMMEVKASTAKDAENIAWMQRGSYWGAFGTDNAVDCRVIS